MPEENGKKIFACFACGKDVSKKAHHCPHCGEPYRHGMPVSTWILLALLMIAVAAVSMNIGYTYTNYELNFYQHLQIATLWLPVIVLLNFSILIAITSKRN